ncbi:hypothetical protein DFP72DRAFT_872013 [Ephemerocybe angulata]|uniref:Uncharacterized protein n=1 Tax=Ephemerocybe angulata TaxID=980116 RepID=A0A8H6MFQ8_9AGAR|nr:hypothetical protein DFP72DRAFT_872013 [Tulosesus angulatus]
MRYFHLASLLALTLVSVSTASPGPPAWRKVISAPAGVTTGPDWKRTVDDGPPAWKRDNDGVTGPDWKRAVSAGVTGPDWRREDSADPAGPGVPRMYPFLASTGLHIAPIHPGYCLVSPSVHMGCLWKKKTIYSPTATILTHMGCANWYAHCKRHYLRCLRSHRDFKAPVILKIPN